MRVLSVIAILTILAPSCAHAWWDTIIDTVETTFPDSVLMERYETSHHLGNERIEKTGFYRKWHHNGHLQEEGHYWCNSKTGTWVSWDSLGHRLWEASYRDGQKDGKETTWNINGTERSEAYYRLGKLHGVKTVYSRQRTVGGIMNNPCLSVKLRELYLNDTLVLTIVGERDTNCGGLPCGDPHNPYFSDSTGQWVELRRSCREFYVGRMTGKIKVGKWTLWSEDGYPLEVDLYKDGKRVSE